MKRHGFIFERIMTRENIYSAILKFNSAREPDARVEPSWGYADFLLRWMQNDFRGLIGRPAKYTIIESGKPRQLQVPNVNACIAMIAMWLVCGPFIEGRIHNHSYSSRVGYGGHRAMREVSRFVRENEGGEADWCYFFDISKCYQHIMPPVVMSRLLNIFKDRRALGMFEIVLESAWEGLPIGYPFSHALANLVLSPLHAMMQSHKNVSAGFVYMDNHDFFSRYKNTLRNARPQVDRWLESIGCHAKHDWQIFRPADRGVNICGFTVYPDHVELYRRIWHRIMRNIDAIKTAWQLKDYLSLMSRKGWLMAANKLYTPSLQIEQGEYLWK